MWHKRRGSACLWQAVEVSEDVAKHARGVGARAAQAQAVPCKRLDASRGIPSGRCAGLPCGKLIPRPLGLLCSSRCGEERCYTGWASARVQRASAGRCRRRPLRRLRACVPCTRSAPDTRSRMTCLMQPAVPARRKSRPLKGAQRCCASPASSRRPKELHKAPQTHRAGGRPGPGSLWAARADRRETQAGNAWVCLHQEDPRSRLRQTTRSHCL